MSLLSLAFPSEDISQPSTTPVFGPPTVVPASLNLPKTYFNNSEVIYRTADFFSTTTAQPKQTSKSKEQSTSQNLEEVFQTIEQSTSKPKPSTHRKKYPQNQRSYRRDTYQSQNRWHQRREQQQIHIRELPIESRDDWTPLESWLLQALAKRKSAHPLVITPRTLAQCGLVGQYRSDLDSVTSNRPVPLPNVNVSIPPQSTSSSDPYLQELSKLPEFDGSIFTTEQILAVLMSCPRSHYPWELALREQEHLYYDEETKETRPIRTFFLDKVPFEGSLLDHSMMFENYTNAPVLNGLGCLDPTDSVEVPGYNATFLSHEAGVAEARFFSQAVDSSVKPISIQGAVAEGYPVPEQPQQHSGFPPCGYRYIAVNISNRLSIVYRARIDAVLEEEEEIEKEDDNEEKDRSKNSGKTEKPEFVNIHTLNELNPHLLLTLISKTQNLQQTTQQMYSNLRSNWKGDLISQLGIVLSKEAKHNIFKLSRWFYEAMLARVTKVKVGFASRVSNTASHTLLKSATYKLDELAALINIDMSSGWEILTTILSHVMATLMTEKEKLKEDEEYKLHTYIIMREPTKVSIQLLSVPNGSIDAALEGRRTVLKEDEVEKKVGQVERVEEKAEEAEQATTEEMLAVQSALQSFTKRIGLTGAGSKDFRMAESDIFRSAKFGISFAEHEEEEHVVQAEDPVDDLDDEGEFIPSQIHKRAINVITTITEP
ncbi:putative Eukaryotic translation initiation factor 3 subunit D [Blattamonas nauphoetae]|uniref:Eukaryotic translation initiation factor 3 subunit D n=1 Tax=Blattamonas nauphoetae TaxID=2049346 RepID=A0ABQ9YEI2_9EUKA|nr:putative Eukaryotic translation initiation factor 3 subunit D [Blattamonas nauphoetae]